MAKDWRFAAHCSLLYLRNSSRFVAKPWRLSSQWRLTARSDRRLGPARQRLVARPWRLVATPWRFAAHCSLGPAARPGPPAYCSQTVALRSHTLAICGSLLDRTCPARQRIVASSWRLVATPWRFAAHVAARLIRHALQCAMQRVLRRPNGL